MIARHARADGMGTKRVIHRRAVRTHSGRWVEAINRVYAQATVYDQKEDQMKKKTATLLDVAKKAHRDGNRNVRTADGALINVEGFRNGWVTAFRNGIGPDFIHSDIAADIVVTDLGRREPTR